MRNKVQLLGYYGGDESHCLSAWQSTNVELGLELPEEVSERIHALFEETVKSKKKSSKELLSMLAQHGHHTPFEKSALHFQITGDIASHIHCLKHRIGISVNSESARYKELSDKWYLPEDWDEVEPTVTDEMFCVGIDNRFTFTWADVLDKYAILGHKLYHEAVKQLTPVLGRKRAKESARYFLPYNKQLDFDMMFNFRSFVHFVKLRGSSQAQEEIQDIANQMVDLVESIPGNPFQLSLEAHEIRR